MRLAIVLIALLLGACKLHAHEIYNGLQKNGTYDSSRSPCCGDTDCEPLQLEDVKFLDNGDAVFFSHRHKKEIRVSRDVIVYVGLPPNKKGEVFPVHWCGGYRTGTGYYPYGNYTPGETSPTADQPDKVFTTYCAFIAPGGA